ncbi:MAG: ABC transporter permease [Gammaproteobacteria bacterium]|nr:ABC transporter permease [Gammaproteobacteria bacterium]
MALLRGFFRKEFMQALRDPRMKFILFVAPLIQLIIFGVAISTDVKNIRLWANPDSKDYILQHVYEHSIESGWFLPAIDNDDNVEPFDLLRGGKIDAAIIASPGGLTKAIGRGTADLQLLIDATNVIQAQSVELYIKNIVNNVVVQDLNQKPPDNPIYFSVRVLFNPTLQTSYFMIPGVMCLLMCIVSVALTNISITSEKESGTFEMLIAAPVSSTEIILGKTIPYVIISMFSVPLILFVAIFIFGIPMRGSLLVLVFASFVFVCSCVAIGTLISTFAKNQQQSMLGMILFLFPAVMFSGLMFPLENMPTIMKFIAYLDPLSHFLEILRNIMLKGGEIHFISLHVGILILMAVIFVYISFKRFRTTLQ